MLRLLHKALGEKIPLHEFFDLIVGTRYFACDDRSVHSFSGLED